MIAKLAMLGVGLLRGLGAGEGATKSVGILNGFGMLAAAAGAVAWLFGPAREWEITLNALELSGVALGASLVLEYVRRLNPPGGGGG